MMRSFWRKAKRGAHDSAPELGSLPDDVAQRLIEDLDPAYTAKVRNLGQQLDGSVVVDSTGGHSGYLLRLADGGYVAVWLDSDLSRMEFFTDTGDPPAHLISLLSNPDVPDASAPLDIDRPYANERNDISTEARRAHGHPITGVAVGQNAFSLCFPDDIELEGHVLQLPDGRLALRVFWEQW
jgi:hypothetical protein